MLNRVGSMCPRLTYLGLRIPRLAGGRLRAQQLVVRVTYLSRQARESHDPGRHVARGSEGAVVSAFLPSRV